MKGLGVSKGIGIGKVVRLETELRVKKNQISDKVAEFNKFKVAQKTAEDQIEDIINAGELSEDKKEIFRAHKMIINDPELSNGVKHQIDTDSCNADFAVKVTSEAIMETFLAIPDPYFQERAADVKDVATRIMSILTGTRIVSEYPKYAHVLVAKDLAPSQTAIIDTNYTMGIVTEIGGDTSHSAIIARSLSIPAVMGIGEGAKTLHDDSVIIVDGGSGEVLLEPDEATLIDYRKKIEDEREERERLLAFKDMTFHYEDGRHIEIAGNIASPEEAAKVVENGGEGVGLFRSEFIYMNRTTPPTEDEQYAAYKEALEGLAGKPLTIRTMDIGGDKEVDYINIPEELNPFLGFRAIRYCFEDIDLFKTQLRALFRASVHGPLRIMFPMISGIQEVVKTKEIIETVKVELKEKGVAYSETVEIGIMIEIPSAAIMSDLLAKEVDFASIGTNDLTQYTLACDRMNPKVGDLYSNFDPAVIRLIKMTIDNFQKEGKWVGMCGSAAGNPKLIPVWYAFGMDEFSMTPNSIPKAKSIMNKIDTIDLEVLKENVLKAKSKQEVEQLLDI